MANVETRRDEYTFLGSGCNIRTHLLRAAARPRVYFIEIWARGGSREERTVRMRPGGKSNGESPFFETPNLSFEGRVGILALNVMGPGGLRSEVAGRACGSWWLAETAMASASPHRAHLSVPVPVHVAVRRRPSHVNVSRRPGRREQRQQYEQRALLSGLSPNGTKGKA